jgi:hypothetical protein
MSFCEAFVPRGVILSEAKDLAVFEKFSLTNR